MDWVVIKLNRISAVFGDVKTANAILQTPYCAVAKKLGRSVTNYDEGKWHNLRFSVMKHLCYRKFAQNPELRKILLSTKGCILAEASETDRIWGIGENT